MHKSHFVMQKNWTHTSIGNGFYDRLVVWQAVRQSAGRLKIDLKFSTDCIVLL